MIFFFPKFVLVYFLNYISDPQEMADGIGKRRVLLSIFLIVLQLKYSSIEMLILHFYITEYMTLMDHSAYQMHLLLRRFHAYQEFSLTISRTYSCVSRASGIPSLPLATAVQALEYGSQILSTSTSYQVFDFPIPLPFCERSVVLVDYF